jgi:2-haloacid dehalogenase
VPEIKIRPDYVTFDCYGTLINFEIQSVTRRLLGDQLTDEEFTAFVPAFRAYRYDQVCGDSYYAYEQVLEDSFTRVCRRWGLQVPEGSGKAFGDAVRSWGPHADVPAPLAKLAGEFPLVILSNADDAFLDISVPRLGADFHAVYTAEQAGAYKPRYQAFEYMLDSLGTQPDKILHVSSHTRYDIMPCVDLGITNTVLLDRGYDPPSPSYGYVRVESLDELNTLLGL